MNYLADTHILIWAITDSPKLSQNAREILKKDADMQIDFAQGLIYLIFP